MNKKIYIQPETETIILRLSNPVLVVGDLDWGSSDENSDLGWAGAKEQEFDTDETDDIWNMETKDVWER